MTGSVCVGLWELLALAALPLSALSGVLKHQLLARFGGTDDSENA